VVADFASASPIQIIYCVEPERNIALARNRALENARGDFIAFIDDDEFPAHNWLANLLTTLEKHAADGVLGPVRPFFDTPPPAWLVRGRFCQRPEHPTGLLLNWRQTRTGNVFFKQNNFNFTGPLILLAFLGMWLYWHFSARKWFTGPRVQGTKEELQAIEREFEQLG
jgi:glycosyltransferase involved in cell wall biosynthesis